MYKTISVKGHLKSRETVTFFFLFSKLGEYNTKEPCVCKNKFNFKVDYNMSLKSKLKSVPQISPVSHNLTWQHQLRRPSSHTWFLKLLCWRQRVCLWATLPEIILKNNATFCVSPVPDPIQDVRGEAPKASLCLLWIRLFTSHADALAWSVQINQL